MNQTIRYSDKLLPDQPAFIEQFTGSREEFFPALLELMMASAGLKEPSEEFRLLTTDKHSIQEMGSNPIALQFLKLLIRLHRPKKAIEIGTFVGISGMSMASALPPGGKLITLEKFSEFADIAQKNFETNGFTDRIELLRGDAFELKSEIKAKGPYDFAFIDGNKERYDEYFYLLDPLMSPGGMIIVDDVFFHGDAVNAVPQGEKGKGARRCLDASKAATNYFRLVLPLGNGVLVMLKQGAR